MNNINEILTVLYRRYKYILKKETIDSIFKEVSSKIDVNSSEFKSEINKYFQYYINLITSDKARFIKLINNYINKSFDNNSMKDYNKLEEYLKRFNYIYSPDFCIELINKNDKLRNILKSIVDENINSIKNNDIQSINSSNLFLTFIETYCDINNIDISDSDNEIIEKLKESDYQIDGNLLQIYIKEINKPLLTNEEEQQLIIRKNNGDEEARRILIESNLRYVIKYAFKFIGKSQYDIKDIIQDGNIGLIIGVDKLEDKGYRALTYIHFWIRSIINRSICSKSRLIRLPDNIYYLHKKYLNSKEKLRFDLNREPSNYEISLDMGVKLSVVENLSKVPEDAISLNIKKYSVLGRDEIINTVSDEMINTIAAQDIEDTEKQAIKNMSIAEIRDCFYNSELSEREKRVLELRYGFNGEEVLSLEKIGKQFNITKQKINLIEAKALTKLRNYQYRKKLVDLTENPKYCNKVAVDLYQKYFEKNYQKNLKNKK